jgi:Leucine-rich repeat (LRR) protein
VIEEDLPFFSNLQVLNAGANNLRLSDLVALPALTELLLHCNGIERLESGGELKRFDSLQVGWPIYKTARPICP